MADTEGLTILLGAGASIEAGLPASFSLTQRVSRQLEAEMGQFFGTSLALNIAIGAIIAFDTARGKGAFDGIDVERLFSAIQMLSQRDSVELTPFVASWNSALEEVGRSRDMPSSFQRRFSDGLLGSFPANFGRVFREGVDAAVGRDNKAIFGQLERQMVAALQRVLRVNPAKVDYLGPLLAASPGPVRIATLNYDRTIEVLAERAGRTVDVGVDKWSSGFDWTWSDPSDVRLLKLHGSVDWWRERVKGGERQLPAECIVIDTERQADGRSFLGPDLALIFGQRGKLRSDGPFLAMLRGFDDFLAQSNRLVVVGYSFRDDHINESIRRWFNGRSDPRLSIIDPGLAGVSRWDRDRPEFQQQLINAVTKEPEPGPGLRTTELRLGHQILPVPASTGLLMLFGDGPTLAPVGPGDSADVSARNE